MAYYFNGATHQIIRSDAVVSTWPITLHARVRLPNSDSNEHYICGFHESGSGSGFYLTAAFVASAHRLRMNTRDGGGVAAAGSGTNFTVGQWHSCVGEVTAANSRSSWIDNGTAGSNIVSRSPGTLAKTSIGAYDVGGTLSSNVDHEIADVAVWSGTLTSDDRAALAAGVSPALIKPHNLELYVPLIRGGNDWMGGAFTVNNATVADHPRVYMPARPRIIGIAAASTGPSGPLAATEGADTASLSGVVLVQGSAAATEGADTAAIAGIVPVQGSLAASEASDGASLAGLVLVQGSLSASEGADSASLAGTVPVQGSMSVSEGSDSVSATGLVLVQGVLGATEGADTAAFSGSGLQTATGALAGTEGADSASIAGAVLVQGSVSTSESADAAAIVGQLLIQGSLSASEVADTLLFMGSMPVSRRTVGARTVSQSRPGQTSHRRPAQLSGSRPPNTSRGNR